MKNKIKQLFCFFPAILSICSCMHLDAELDPEGKVIISRALESIKKNNGYCIRGEFSSDDERILSVFTQGSASIINHSVNAEGGAVMHHFVLRADGDGSYVGVNIKEINNSCVEYSVSKIAFED